MNAGEAPEKGPVMLDQTTDLASLLKDPDLLVTKAYLAGEWTEGTGGRTFEVTNTA